jgi:hypothetical protein
MRKTILGIGFFVLLGFLPITPIRVIVQCITAPCYPIVEFASLSFILMAVLYQPQDILLGFDTYTVIIGQAFIAFGMAHISTRFLDKRKKFIEKKGD